MKIGLIIITCILVIIGCFLPTWAQAVLAILSAIVLIGDKLGVDKYGDNYRFDDGVDR